MAARVNGLSLAVQFFVVGGLVSLLAMLMVGAVVTTLIERAVTRNAGATTALYVDSVIAPLLPDMRNTQVLDDAARQALDETLGQGALGRRLAAMRLWSRDGTILYAEDESLIDRRFVLTPDIKSAFAGNMVANYDRFDILDKDMMEPSGPLLEIYNPILQPWSGNVVAVIEFYEYAHDFEATLQNARLRSWLAVAGVTVAFFLALYAVVVRGSRTIDRQARDLSRRVGELTTLLDQNRALHQRVQTATQRTTALNESYLRRLAADLHDGPTQFVALASMRLDSETVLGKHIPHDKRESEVSSIRASLEEALQEIRDICNGLVLPQIEMADLPELIGHAIAAYERRTGMQVEQRLDPVTPALPISERICIYRFLQEALNNGYRHCRGASQIVTMTCDKDKVVVTVSDEGPGFDPDGVAPGSLGLAGLRERVKSLGGSFDLDTSEKGTVLTVTLSLKEPAPS
ncbi:sensor histidine kinase [Mesorhizobium sp. CN2-181]|uniref:sensor histidine kinase n=1 Tax=Mesorhizobium yinganensis TaxID=3157707 RepID=UPI0032B86B5A